MRKRNLRLIAALLILVFSQKMGVRLWLHEWLHDRSALKCECIDDLMMPMTGAHCIVMVTPEMEYTIPVVARPCIVFSPDRHFPSLRGPPPIA